MWNGSGFRITNARVVLPDAVVDGGVVVEDGIISQIGPPAGAAGPAVDLEGDYLLPGLVELHTDNMEKHVQPRPGADIDVWPALLGHDLELVGCGITTAFNATSVGDTVPGGFRNRIVVPLLEAVRDAGALGLLRCDHRVHLRCEVSDPDCAMLFQAATAVAPPELLSLTDHTPGQRQWSDLDRFRAHYGSRLRLSAAELDDLVQRRVANQRRHASAHAAHILASDAARAAILASHDDTTDDHVLKAVGAGVAISEFPTTQTAAALAARHGLAVVMGAPNFVRGGSHSGNACARTLVSRGLVSILSSDYAPASLLQAAFKAEDLGLLSLPAAVRLVASAPAEAARLDDRGSVRVGLRADLLRVRRTAHGPAVLAVWTAGRRLL